MIILSGVLVVVAIALLVTGIVTGNSGTEFLHLDGLKLIYISIAISIVSALCLAVGVVLRRKELFGSPAPKSATAKSQAKAERTAAKATKPAKAKAKAGVTSAATTAPSSGVAADVPAETAVYVVPGRKRYHLETCRQLAGREREELTFEEAREEGFTPCTACLPDTALAARAATHESDTSVDEGSWPDEPQASETRTDLPAFEAQAIPPSTPAAPVAEEEPSPLYDALTAREAESAFDSSAEESPLAEESSAAQSSHVEERSAAEETGSVFDSVGSSHGSLFEPVARSGSVFDPPSDATAEEEAGQPEGAHKPAEETAEETASPQVDDADAGEARVDDAEAASDTETTQHIDVVPDVDAEEPVSTDGAPSGEAEKTADAGESSVTAEEARADVEGEVPPVGEDADAPAVDEKADADQATVRILSGTKRYHRPDCALIEDIGEDAEDLESLSRSAAKERGCTPCLVCQPDKDAGARD